jgi:hypothetical protein
MRLRHLLPALLAFAAPLVHGKKPAPASPAAPPPDRLVSIAWPASIAPSGPVSVTAQSSTTGPAAASRRLQLTVFESNWLWKGHASAALSADGTATVTLAQYPAFVGTDATLRLALQDATGATTYDSIDRTGVPVAAQPPPPPPPPPVNGPAASRVRTNLGTNFWFVYHDEPADGFTGGRVFRPGVNFATTDNPWDPVFLEEIRPYQVLRFMDWFGGNGDAQRDWATQRTRRADPLQRGGTMGPERDGFLTDISPARQPDGRATWGVAVEWLIDLCNRNQSDLWINIPYRALDAADFPHGDDFLNEYVHKLALLLKTGIDLRDVNLKAWLGGKQNLPLLATKTRAELIAAGGIDTGPGLEPALKIYVEYSNELWCCARPQVKWVEDQGAALGFATPRHFGAWAEVRAWKAFQDVFGAQAMGGARVWRVAGPTHKEALNAYSFQGYFDHIYRNPAPRGNPWWRGASAPDSVRPDAWKWAAYLGGDGSPDDWAARAEEERAHAIALRDVMRASFGIDKLFAYEGGQHLDQNAGPFAHAASSYERYREWLHAVDDGYDLILHYVHYGRWQRADDSAGYGSWGAKSHVGQPLEAAHKYRALLDYVSGN